MRIDTRPRHKNAPRLAEKDCPSFKQWTRGRPCIFAFTGGCGGKIEAMHLDFAGGKGVGTKVADRYCVPSCEAHHRLQHTKGWTTFLREVAATREELLDAAARLWAKWPGRISWERKLEQ